MPIEAKNGWILSRGGVRWVEGGRAGKEPFVGTEGTRGPGTMSGEPFQGWLCFLQRVGGGRAAASLSPVIQALSTRMSLEAEQRTQLVGGVASGCSLGR